MAFDPNTLVTIVISGGGVAFVGALVKAYRDIKNGAKARDRDTVGSLREQRDDAELRMNDAILDRDFFQQLCGRLMYQLTTAGIEPVTGANGVIPPSMRADREPPAPPPTRRGRRTTAT